VMAIEIIKVIAKTSLKLVEDIGVVGRLELEYDYRSPTPPSTWAMDRRAVGARAVTELLARVSDPRGRPGVVRLPLEFVDRNTA
jgi:DNA-binding LacI/PurR family transcriptional regulator